MRRHIYQVSHFFGVMFPRSHEIAVQANAKGSATARMRGGRPLLCARTLCCSRLGVDLVLVSRAGLAVPFTLAGHAVLVTQ